MRWNVLVARCLLTFVVAAAMPLSAQSGTTAKPRTAARAPARTAKRRAPKPAARPTPKKAAPSIDQADAVYADAASAALSYLKAHRSRTTGLVSATPGWANITLWDVGSLLGAVYSAGELGLLSPAERDEWLGSLLKTMTTAPLAADVAYNRIYTVGDARMIGDKDAPSKTGSGWSTTDLGRLLIWLKVIETKVPAQAAAARAVAQRIDFARVVQNDALMGADIKAGKPVFYGEGRVGYEQYSARGFELWGHPPAKNLDPTAHGHPVHVLGQTLLHDDRGNDKLTSEPFILMGMELGYRAPFDQLSKAMLAAQEARYKQTGKVTMVSEDAIQVAPWYFYYYSVYSDGETFAVRAHGPVKNGPRWVSAKAAFAWHALYPSDYTWTTVQTVLPAQHPEGWDSGVFEGGARSTGVLNLNTSAVILEAALYRKLGKPFLS
jgi:hypothetical protein